MGKKESSFRGNVLWSVKLQPVVLHIVPEALQKLILQRDQRCLEGKRGRGAEGLRDTGGGEGWRSVIIFALYFY